MVDGDIVEHGTHDDLMAKQGVYYQMQTAQAGRKDVKLSSLFT